MMGDVVTVDRVQITGDQGSRHTRSGTFYVNAHGFRVVMDATDLHVWKFEHYTFLATTASSISAHGRRPTWVSLASSLS